MSKIVLLLSGIVTFLSTHVSALPATDTFKLRQDEGGYVAFDIDGANGQHMTLGLNADGQKYLVSTLHCYDRDAGAAAAGCASTKVSYLPPSWDGYCCEIDWNQCLNQGTIMNGGFTIDPPQSMDLIRCRAQVDGVCPAWPSSILHNGCKQ